MADMRIPLASGAELDLDGRAYTIRGVLASGGSCIAYIAERVPTELERESGMPPLHVIIKEFYPAELSGSITRNCSCLAVAESERSAFESFRDAFLRGAAQSAAFYGDVGNHALPPADIDAANGTAYSVVALTRGVTLERLEPKLDVNDTAQAMVSLCNAVDKLHGQDRLYLDIKPANVFLFDKDCGETRRVALFDFDTTLTKDDLATTAIPHTPGWSPIEQARSRRDTISSASDVYAIGTVFYWLLTDSKISDSVLTDIENEDYECLDCNAELCSKHNARRAASDIFAATLRRHPSDRIQNAKELRDMFEKLGDLAKSGGAISDKIDELAETVKRERAVPIQPTGAMNISGNTAQNQQFIQTATFSGGNFFGNFKDNPGKGGA